MLLKSYILKMLVLLQIRKYVDQFSLKHIIFILYIVLEQIQENTRRGIHQEDVQPGSKYFFISFNYYLIK